MNESLINSRKKTNKILRVGKTLRYELKDVAISDNERQKRIERMKRRTKKANARLDAVTHRSAERGAATQPWMKRDADRLRAINSMSAEDREAVRLRLEKRFAAKGD